MGGRELLVSCSDDFTLFLWDPADTKRPVVRMVGHQQPVNHMQFSPGKLVPALTEGGILDARRLLRLSLDGRFIASASFDKKVKLWDGRTGKFLVNYMGHVGEAARGAGVLDGDFESCLLIVLHSLTAHSLSQVRCTKCAGLATRALLPPPQRTAR